MANRRMFSKSITNSSRFLMMPLSAQALYFHLGMNADDDGYCEIFTIMRLTDAKPDDFKILAAKQFIHIFDDKVLIILDWKENNYIQKDRYTPSKYLSLYPIENIKKIECIQNVSNLDTDCIQIVSNLDTQVSIGKYSIELDKDSLGKDKNNTNNLSNNNISVCDENFSCDEDSTSSHTHTKKIFLSNVWLTDHEYQSLLSSLGQDKTQEYIYALDNYINQIGKQKAKKYKSHYHTILNWHRRDKRDEETRIKLMKIKSGQIREEW